MLTRAATGSGLCWVLAGAAVLGLAPSASALPPVSVPFATDAPVPFFVNVAPYDLGSATDGTQVLTVFEESGSIRGMLTDESGSALLPQMLSLDPREPDVYCYYPDVAFGADKYLVTWSSNTGVFAQFVDAQGTLSGAPLQLDADGLYPVAAWNGAAFVVAWLDFSDAGRDIVALTLSAEGQASAAAPVTFTGDATEPQIAASGDTTLVTWYSNPDTQSAGLFAALLDAQGIALQQEPLHLADAGAYDPTVVTGNDNFLVAYRFSGTPEQIQGALVSTAGQVTPELEIGSAESLTAPSVGFDGERFAIVWKAYNPSTGPEPDSYFLQHLSVTGEKDAQDTELTAFAVDQSSLPSLLWVGDKYWAAYPDQGVRGRWLDAAGLALGEPTALSLLPHPEGYAQVFWDGTQYWETWADEREGRDVLNGYAVRITTQGQVLDAPPLQVSPAEHGAYALSPATRGNGGGLASWVNRESDKIFARELRPDGTLGDVLEWGDAGGSGVGLVSAWQGYFSVHIDSSTPPYTAVGRLHDAQGVVQGQPLTLHEQEAYLDALVLASAEGPLLSYRDGATYLAPISEQGELGEPLLLSPGSAQVQTVHNGSVTLVVWGAADLSRYARFYAQGAWQGEQLLLTTDGLWGSNVWDGEQFLLLWENSEHKAWLSTFTAQGEQGPAEQLLEQECSGAALASNGQGQSLLSCTQYIEQSRSRRLVNYLLGDPIAVVPTTSPSASAAEPDAGVGAAPSSSQAGTETGSADAATPGQPEPSESGTAQPEPTPSGMATSVFGPDAEAPGSASPATGDPAPATDAGVPGAGGAAGQGEVSAGSTGCSVAAAPKTAHGAGRRGLAAAWLLLGCGAVAALTARRTRTARQTAPR